MKEGSNLFIEISSNSFFDDVSLTYNDDEWDKDPGISYRHWVSFTDDEFNKIKELIIDIIYLPIIEDATSPINTARTFSEKFDFIIIKTMDEWFYVACLGHILPVKKYFKCDQFDGLMDLILHEIII